PGFEGVAVSVLVPAVALEEEGALPAGGDGRQTGGVEVEGDLVAGGEDHGAVVHRGQQLAAVAVAGVAAGEGEPGGLLRGVLVDVAVRAVGRAADQPGEAAVGEVGALGVQAGLDDGDVVGLHAGPGDAVPGEPEGGDDAQAVSAGGEGRSV